MSNYLKKTFHDMNNNTFQAKLNGKLGLKMQRHSICPNDPKDPQ